MENKRMDYSPLWNRYLPMLRKAKLSKEQLGDLFMAILEYQAEDHIPENLDQACEIFWGFFQEDLERARLKYALAVEKGKKGGRPKKQEKAEESREKPKKGRTTSTTTSTTSTSLDTGSAPATSAGVCCETHSFGEFGWVKLTVKQFERLKAHLGSEELQRCITYVDEAAQSPASPTKETVERLSLFLPVDGRQNTVKPLGFQQNRKPRGFLAHLTPLLPIFKCCDLFYFIRSADGRRKEKMVIFNLSLSVLM